MTERKWIKRFSDKWNERFKICSGAYVGRLNVERMLREFLKAYKRSKK